MDCHAISLKLLAMTPEKPCHSELVSESPILILSLRASINTGACPRVELRGNLKNINGLPRNFFEIARNDTRKTLSFRTCFGIS